MVMPHAVNMSMKKKKSRSRACFVLVASSASIGLVVCPSFLSSEVNSSCVSLTNNNTEANEFKSLQFRGNGAEQTRGPQIIESRVVHRCPISTWDDSRSLHGGIHHVTVQLEGFDLLAKKPRLCITGN